MNSREQYEALLEERRRLYLSLAAADKANKKYIRAAINQITHQMMPLARALNSKEQ